jgi:hypothetical protein
MVALTLILPMWKIGWAPNNASKWQMGFNSVFKRLRRSARISKLDRKTNEYIREKMNAQDMMLDDITRKQIYLVWSCRENGPNTTTRNYDLLETWRKETTRPSPENLERWNKYSHEWKRSKNGRMEQSKAMEYESRKASSDVLKLRNWCTWCARNTWRYTKFENLCACYAGLPHWRSSRAITYGTNVQTAQISVRVLMTMFPRRLVLTFADILPARSPDLAVPDHFLRSYVKKQDIRNSSFQYWRPSTANSGVYSRDP